MNRSPLWLFIVGVLAAACSDPPAPPPAPSAPASVAPAATVKAPPAAPDALPAALLRPEIPPDVDPAELEKLKKAHADAEIQALFDRFSWQSFVALNWPTDAAGKPAPRIGDKGSPAWMGLKESFDVFLEDGSKPAPWGARGKLRGDTPTSSMPALPAGKAGKREARLLFTPGARPRRAAATTADELNQAFTFPLWDQAGNIVYYEVLMNRPEFEYLVQNELYNYDGQIAFAQKNPGKDLDPQSCNHPNKTVVVMPSGRHGTKDEGAIEVKLAWKILGPNDVKERYVVAEGLVPKDITITGTCAAGNQQAVIKGTEWAEVTLGLVGLHISHKTTTSPQWVWSTFEQVDNLAVNPLSSGGRKLTPSFNDPACETCLVNTCVDPPLDKSGHVVPGAWRKPQLQRVIPISQETAAENRRFQQLLAAQGSALQYYELVGTQFPTAPDAIPTSPRADKHDKKSCEGPDPNPTNLPESVANKAGGKPHTVFLTNLTMESYFQSGNQAACNQVENGACPASLPVNAPMVFATESCIGCHSSAPITVGKTTSKSGDPQPKAGNQLTADFSWLLLTKAHWKKP